MSNMIKDLETRVARTYRGGALLDTFLGRDSGEDSFFPEDWITSFVETKIRTIAPTRVPARAGWRSNVE